MPNIEKGENKFYIGDDIKEPLAELTFVESGENRIVVDHTYVSEELRGQGIAGKLVDEVVSYAREKNKKIIPLCPYAKEKIEKTQEYHDVLGE